MATQATSTQHDHLKAEIDALLVGLGALAAVHDRIPMVTEEDQEWLRRVADGGLAEACGVSAESAMPVDVSKRRTKLAPHGKWSPEPGLNQRHPVYKTGALPTELSGPRNSLTTGHLSFTQEGIDEIANAVAQRLRTQTPIEQKQWPALMTIKVAKEYTGLGESKIKQLIVEKQLTNSSPDSTTRIQRKDLDALMERKRRS